MSSPEKKICKMCCMEIPYLAKKCPQCQHLQNKLTMIAYHPLFGMTIGIILITCMGFCFHVTFSELFSEGEAFEKHRNLLSLEETNMVFGMRTSYNKSKYPTVTLLGKIINTSDITWKNIIIEGQILNKDGKLIDTKQTEKYDFIVPAHGKSAFKLSYQMEFPKSEYKNFKIFIRSAEDQRKRF